MEKLQHPVMKIHLRMTDHSKQWMMRADCHQDRWIICNTLEKRMIKLCGSMGSRKNGLAKIWQPEIGTALSRILGPENGLVGIPRVTNDNGEIHI
jgi:hypothetical protein